YQSSFTLIEKHLLKTVAFPSISTGVYRFPLERATEIAITETLKFLKRNNFVEKIIFVCFNKNVYDCYVAELKKNP
ncbi:MAG: macro domain-containing protein, partial [Candidatus Atribacteria bacterium]|nr:macro domain-containing protein [Candidatus Atribacteria bacterium]